MRIKLLGAHNTESISSRYVSILVDDVLAIEAGCLTSSLSFEEQLRIQNLLLTHGHYDHIRDVPALAINRYLSRCPLKVYTHQAVYDNITQFMLNSKLYSEFHKKPEENPTLDFHLLAAGQSVKVGEYNVLGVPVKHSITTLGYQITDPNGACCFYSGDTGHGLFEIWDQINPGVIFVELTAAEKWRDMMKNNGHMTPGLLIKDLTAFRSIKGYLPRVITVHMNPRDETMIRSEVQELAAAEGLKIEIGYEGMLVEL